MGIRGTRVTIEASGIQETTTDTPPPDHPPESRGEGSERRTGDIVVEADVYNSMLIAGKILRLVERQKVPVSVKVTPGESVELDIAVKVLETVVSGAVLATLKDLYSYLKRRRN